MGDWHFGVQNGAIPSRFPKIAKNRQNVEKQLKLAVGYVGVQGA